MSFAVQRVGKLDQHVKDIAGRVAIKHGNRNQVQIKKPTTEVDANAQVEERLATVRATVTR